MSLPKLVTPTYEMKLISDGRKIVFRPFLVKEQKVLMMANETEDSAAMIRSFTDVLKACIISPKDFDVNKMPLFDLEYAFIQLRTKSVGETTKIPLTCKHCKTENELVINLEELDIIRDENHSTKIPLTDTIGLIMKYPVAEMAIELSNEKNEKDTQSAASMFDFYEGCIQSVYDENTVYNMEDQSKEERHEFMDSLNSEQFEKVRNFFETMPKIQKHVSFTCSNDECKKENTFDLEGMNSFF